MADLKTLCAIRHDPVRRRALFSSCTFLAYHSVLKHFIQAVVLLYGAAALGLDGWEGNEESETYLLGLMVRAASSASASASASASTSSRVTAL